MSRASTSFAFGFAMVAQTLCAQSPLFRELGPELPATPFAATLSADFDLDGDRDLLGLSGSFNAAFSVLHNDGAGRFAAGPTVAPAGPFQLGGVAVADFDGDGDADVAYARDGLTFSHRVDLLLNVGGAFVPSPGFAASAFCIGCQFYLRALDADQDGDQDLVVASWGSAPQLYLNLGGLAFSASPGALAGASAFAVLSNAGDVDGDGDEDLYEAGGNGAVRALLNSGGGVFVPSTPFAAAAAGAVFGFGDFDGDGRRDVAAAVLPTFGAGPEAFVSFATGAPVVLAALPNGAGAFGIFGVDLDGDGVDEVCRQRLESLEFSSVGATAVLAAAPAGGGYSAFAADVDADGDADVVYGSSTGERRILRNRGDGTLLDAAAALPPAFEAFHYGGSLLADVDGDGRMDVVGVSTAPSGGFSTGAGPLNVALNDGRGAFPTVLAANPTGAAQQHSGPTAAADFDLDGDGDFAFREGSALFVRRGDGAGGFTTTSTAAGLFETAVEIVAADVDQDGDADLLVAANLPSSGSATLFRNLGGTFAAPVVLYSAVGSSAVNDLAVFDADQDGDLDVALAGPATAALLTNDGTGVFTASTPFGATGAATVAAGDVDGDGDVDVLFGDALRLRVGGAYVAGPPVAAGNPAAATPRRRLLDLDDDGLADLLAADAWRRALGGGSFGPDEAIRPFTPPQTPTNLFWDVADVDLDGDLDLFDRTGAFRWNVRRQLARGMAGAIGRTGSLEIYGPANAPYDLAVALAAAPAPVALGPWGLLHLDLASVALVASGALNANGEAAVAIGVPNLPALVGLELYWQAVLPAEARLTGAVRTEILRL